MKRKIRLMTTIVAMCMVVLIMSMGIYAATNVSVGSTGTITFTALTDISADIAGSYGGTVITNSYDVTENEETLGQQVNLVNTPVSITFDDDADTYEIAFTVTNTFTANYSISASLICYMETSKFIKMTATVKNGDDAVNIDTTQNTATPISIAKGETLDINVVISVDSNNYTELRETGAEVDFNFVLTLAKGN